MSIRTASFVLAAIALSLGTSLASASDQFQATNEVGVKLHPLPSTKSRAEVKRALQAARQDGSLETGDDPDYPHATATSAPGKTRAEVKRELQAWEAYPVTADGYRERDGELGWVRVR